MEQSSRSNYYHYNKVLLPYAHKLKKRMTKAEACLWKYVLNGRRIKGYRFRRQRPVLNYIADFICTPLNLIIEVDGITHTWEEVIEKDIIRQRKLEEAGFRVIRFTDEEVLTNINRVFECIEKCVEEIEKGLR
jgi:very-short-patch-repair endonuclease